MTGFGQRWRATFDGIHWTLDLHHDKKQGPDDYHSFQAVCLHIIQEGDGHTTQLANSIAKQAEVEEVVCPRMMKKGVLAVRASDNVDQNRSSKTSTNSFHEIAVSMFQVAMKLLVKLDHWSNNMRQDSFLGNP